MTILERKLLKSFRFYANEKDSFFLLLFYFLQI